LPSASLSPLPRLLRGLARAVADWLLAPVRRRAARRLALLQRSQEALLSPLSGRGEEGLAILEGALALAMADAQFGDDEWELFTRGMALLNLQDQQRRSLSLQGSVDLAGVCSTLAALGDPSLRLAIARFYSLLADADGRIAPAEQHLLTRLLNALDVDPRDLDRLEVPAELRLPPGRRERLRRRLAAPLQRWASPRQSARG
jgi:DNA-binding transcriptional ArsR family regulator